MKKFLFLTAALFYTVVHSMSFEKIPMPIMLQIVKLTADSEENLTHLLLSKRASKNWHALINNQEIQKILKERKLVFEKQNMMRNWLNQQLINNGASSIRRKHRSECRHRIPCDCDL